MKQLPLIQVNPINSDRYYVNEYKPSLKYASVTNVLAKTISKSMAYGLQIWMILLDLAPLDHIV